MQGSETVGDRSDLAFAAQRLVLEAPRLWVRAAVPRGCGFVPWSLPLWVLSEVRVGLPQSTGDEDLIRSSKGVQRQSRHLLRWAGWHLGNSFFKGFFFKVFNPFLDPFLTPLQPVLGTWTWVKKSSSQPKRTFSGTPSGLGAILSKIFFDEIFPRR